MPRTKQRKVKRQSAGTEQIMRDFNRLVQLQIQKEEIEAKTRIKNFVSKVAVTLNRWPTEIQNLTLRELLRVDKTPEKENLPSKTPRIPPSNTKKSMVANKTSKSIASSASNASSKISAAGKRVTATSDDGYQSESMTSQASKLMNNMTRTTARTRSSSQDKAAKSRSISQDRKSKRNPSMMMKDGQNQAEVQGSAVKKTRKELMKTPQSKPMNNFVITPKIRLNSAINVLRKPKDGEMVFSTQGSPLLVSTTVNDRTANINVPLRNGNIISLLPFNETSLTDNLHLDDETKHQLKILQSHLSKVLD
ncbi:hypothetical protein TKK_0003821 [Trichogramma kaykai]|uniref:Borealin C-terminal domain-containing protein n=1 Tax=Trichogramma kaykai TaxID=54128 RepID=A0ABD2XP44_9HYME